MVEVLLRADVDQDEKDSPQLNGLDAQKASLKANAQKVFQLWKSNQEAETRLQSERAQRLEMQDYLAKDALAEADKLGVLGQLSPKGDNSQNREEYPTIANDQTGLKTNHLL